MNYENLFGDVTPKRQGRKLIINCHSGISPHIGQSFSYGNKEYKINSISNGTSEQEEYEGNNYLSVVAIRKTTTLKKLYNTSLMWFIILSFATFLAFAFDGQELILRTVITYPICILGVIGTSKIWSK